MPRKSFGEKVREERDERALLHPHEDFAPAGHVAVYIHTRYVERSTTRRIDNGYGYSYVTKEREPAEYTDVHVVDERGWPIEGGTTTIRHWRVVPDIVREERTLHAIDEAFEKAQSYAQTMDVPVVEAQTYNCYRLAMRNDR